MRRRLVLRVSFFVFLTLVLNGSSVFAATVETHVYSARVLSRMFLATCAGCASDSDSASAAAQAPAEGKAPPLSYQTDAQPLHVTAVEHSDAYHARAKIHKIASFATLPLFAAEVALGQSIYNTTPVSAGKKSAHIAVGTGIIALFGVNTITGAWNLLGEDRQDPKGRGLRIVHAILMMASDAGFAATAATGPHGDRRVALTVPTGESTHRAIAFSSIGVGTVGYLLMLLGNH